jgi:hypothetical protein
VSIEVTDISMRTDSRSEASGSHVAKRNLHTGCKYAAWMRDNCVWNVIRDLLMVFKEGAERTVTWHFRVSGQQNVGADTAEMSMLG